MRKYSWFFMLILLTITGTAQKKKDIPGFGIYGKATNNSVLCVQFDKGKSHNYPIMVFWLADEHGKYLQTLYVAESIGKGVFKRADRSTGKWMAGEIQRPAALPYWFHQRGILNEKGTYAPTPTKPVADAYTGATPTGSFIMHLITDQKLTGRYKVFMEINQSWDWNEFWHNNKFPDDREYKTSSQPALVYEAIIDASNTGNRVTFKAIGHSHHSGKDGSLNTDLSTITTALRIVGNCTVTILP